ncbi:hypothetical protein [Carnobacterium antarcticum]|uniref:SLH domain-containing protein n=1 Tax=Carnobacterium antarcticum TaxID=2126436 RepID=A0ABW4NPE5_9LACT|nr:hypothetical protein [Carnobacterium sp. CP1]ALV20741.1 hypothetical protein NY10_116 [Carnobacterium sp. CP1]
MNEEILLKSILTKVRLGQFTGDEETYNVKKEEFLDAMALLVRNEYIKGPFYKEGFTGKQELTEKGKQYLDK